MYIYMIIAFINFFLFNLIQYRKIVITIKIIDLDFFMADLHSLKITI